MADLAAAQRTAAPKPAEAGMALAGPRHAALVQLAARLNGAAPRPAGFAAPGVVQAALKPAVDAGDQPFKQGLIKGRYDPAANNADMHVDPADKENPHLKKGDVVAVFQDLHQAMVANHKTTGKTGTIDWNPQGAAVIKMVVELLGESLGGKAGKLWARLYKLRRTKFGTPPKKRDNEKLSSDIVPEHLAYLGALKGQGVSIKAVGPKLTKEKHEDKLKEFNQNMVDGTGAGNERLAAYKKALDEGMPVSLHIQLVHTQLPNLISTLQSA